MTRSFHLRWQVNPGEGPISTWRSPDGAGTIRLPVTAQFEVRATADLSEAPLLLLRFDIAAGVDGPALIDAHFHSRDGLDLDELQQHFKWRTAVRMVLGHLIANDTGDDSCYGSWMTGATEMPLVEATQLDDDFLEQVAAEYLEAGRGYTAVFAGRYGISRRSAVRWVEKARARGILSRPEVPGAVGGRIVPVAERRPNV